MAFSSIFGILKDTVVFNKIESNVVLLLIIFLCTIIYLYGTKKKYKLPPGPIGLPILGYLPFLGKEPYKTLSALSKKYGNVFGLYLGRQYAVVINEWTAVKEAFGQSATNDKPPNFFDLMPNGFGFSGQNGSEWAEQRRFAVKAMKDVGLGRTRWEELVQEEVKDLVKVLQRKNGTPLDICEVFSSTFSSNIMTLAFGKRLPHNHPDMIAVSKGVDLIMKTFPVLGFRTFLPWIAKVLQKIGAFESTFPLKKLTDFSEIISKYIEERIHERTDDAFVDKYYAEVQNNMKNQMKNGFTETHLRGNTQNLLVGGSETTKTSTIWLLIAVAEHPDVQKKVHQELDNVLGRDGTIAWSERSKLPYTYAVIMESLRWKTLLPINSLRMARENIQVQGYDIPKNTYIVVNNWALHNDPKYWTEADKFIPERFLTNDGKQVNYKRDSYNPFSYGKRSCPGEMIAHMEILLYFTILMQNFEVLPAVGKKVKFETFLGISYQPTNVELRFIPRK